MLGIGERAICEKMLKDGKVVSTSVFTCEGITVACWCVEFDGWLYDMTQHDGEWVYFHRGGEA